MKNKLFFLVFLFSFIFNSPKSRAQCVCDMTHWHEEQHWQALKGFNDSIVMSLSLFSENGREMLCVQTNNGSCYSVDIPFKGEWKMKNLANGFLLIEKISGYRKQAVFDFATRKFTEKKIIIADGPHSGTGND